MTPRSAAVLLLLSACAPKPEAAPPAPPQEVTFTASEFAFSGPDSIAPGFTRITMVNQGAQEHHLILGRLHEGKTIQDLMAFAKENPNGEPPFVNWQGGANGVGGGGSAGSTVNLPAGRYVLICFLPDPTDMVPHLVKGMVRELVVAGPAGTAQAPAAEGTIRMRDFGFESPPLTAGTHTFHVINDGPQTHEIQLVRLNQGATAEQYFAAFAPGAKGPPPGEMLGGPGAYSVGVDGYWTVSLAPGHYLLTCFVPDVGDGMPHAAKGMVQEFTIAAN